MEGIKSQTPNSRRTTLARIIDELELRNCEDERATGQPQGLESEAYLKSTPQGSRSEDARKDVHITRARSAQTRAASGTCDKRVPTFTVGVAN